MFHHNRTWSVALAADATELADKLTEHTWCLCTGFSLGDYLFLNDSTSEDGAGEFAVIRKPQAPGGAYLQVESITFSWCSFDEALQYILEVLGGDYDAESVVISPRIETPAEHGRCPACA